MSQAQLEKKVADYLRDSQALEDYWQRPITAELFDAFRKGVFGKIKVMRYSINDVVRAHEDIAARRRAGAPILVP